MDEHPIPQELEGPLQEEIAKADEAYSRLSSFDRNFLEQLHRLPPLGLLSVEEERVRMRAGQTTKTGEYPVDVETFQTSACPVHLVRPIEAPSLSPVLFFLHGGGWVLGDFDTHAKLICELAVSIGCAVAFIDYPRAPEHPFPAPLEASIVALYEVLEASASLRLDREKFAVGGDSSGGNLSAALILSAAARDLPLPLRQVLLYPVMDHKVDSASYRQFRDNPNLSQATMEWFWSNYLPQGSVGADPLVSPPNASAEMLAQFPPTLLVTCEYDVLRDEGEQFAARLVHAGVEVTAVRWLGALHGFLVTESLSASSSAQACIDTIAQYIRRGFES
ncbi:alpha/beta hydrolase [Silvibacterium acidisoli]|uniref:alpha/beta hydrolase n=1 Tax=Acidobacteriaceae bacterium ZG23-2 TaxID=2883246 RepID=UPI00406CF53E